MKRLLPAILLIFISLWAHTQVTITAGDMPKPGDTLRSSLTLVLEGIDYQATGQDYTWDFAGLTVVNQQIDTFVAVSSTPVIYQAVFNNQFIFPDYKSTVAKKLLEFGGIPNMEISDTYQFFKETDNDYREVGIGVTLSGVALPIMYDQIDTIYRFPMEYGSVDSSYSSFAIDVPNLGYLGIQKFRRNFAEGWGTLISPFGEFETLKVRTEILEFDSIYIDSLNMGIPITREYTEYKWLANGYSLPLLTVTLENEIATASYLDSVRTNFTGVKEDLSIADYSFKAYPNPAVDYLSVSYELLDAAYVKISFYSLYGKEVKKVLHARQERGLYNKLVNIADAGIEPGLYLLVLQIDSQAMVKRVVIQ